MQFIFGSAAGAPSCTGTPVAKAPLITDEKLVIAAGGGAVAADLYAPAVGASTAYGGVVYKSETCDIVKLVVTYLDGDDCNACTTPDTLSKVDVTLEIPAGVAGIQLPPGYINKITAQVVTSAGVGTASVKGDTLSFKSSRAGACGADVLAIA